MQEIGRIVFVQIQPASIKVGEPKRYDPTRLLVVDELLLSQAGVVGVTEDGRHIIDVHNEQHPQTKSRGDNGFSIGFTSHYDSMRTRFGNSIVDGCAGENIIVEADKMYAPDELQAGLAIQQAQTGKFIMLTRVEDIVPCLPFSSYAAQKTLASNEVKVALQFLMHGRRGFLAELTNREQTVPVRAGDVLFKL